MGSHKSKGVPDCGVMNSPTPAKRLHEMNALEDMGQFPLGVEGTGNLLKPSQGGQRREANERKD